MMVDVTQAIWDSRRTTGSKSHWWAPVVVGFAIAFAQITMVYRAWEDCGISGATGLTTASLYGLGLPALTFLNWLLVALPAEVYLPKRRGAFYRWALAVITTTVLVAAETLVLAYYVATPSLPIGGACVANVPDWWPEQIPV